jgi:hypothetical protein
MRQSVDRYYILVVTALLLIFTGATGHSFEITPTAAEMGLDQIRLDYSIYASADDETFAGIPEGEESSTDLAPKPKSPGKAFGMSLVVPGLGQYYYGSRVKPFIFFGIEVTAWVLYFQWRGEADDMTAEFEAYADRNWSQTTYEDYLEDAYDGEGGEYRDDDSIFAQEISHHLPDTKTQQYYEMIGKYDQFAWGWADALWSAGKPRITGPSTTPYSDMRLTYEGMRNDANNKYNDADKMIIVSIANRLISAFEAYFMTKHINRQLEKQSNVFGRIRVRTQLKSYSKAYDTPFLKVTYRF